jgi:hypothetical protein
MVGTDPGKTFSGWTLRVHTKHNTTALLALFENATKLLATTTSEIMLY